ncbi:MAG: S9 family peptidase, partial [Actinomycetota bacterium]
MTRRPDDEAFPRQVARTRSFTSGRPRDVRVSPDGSRVLFLRSPSGTDPVNALWSLDVATGEERVLFDPAGDDAAMTAAERARRERARERGGGLVGYATDDAFARAVTVARGKLHLVDLHAGGAGALTPPGGPARAPRIREAAPGAHGVDGAIHQQ